MLVIFTDFFSSKKKGTPTAAHARMPRGYVLPSYFILTGFTKKKSDSKAQVGKTVWVPSSDDSLTDQVEGSDGVIGSVTMTEVDTKLDLAQAYIDMGDPDNASSILEEVLDEAEEEQRQKAQKLLDDLAH